VEKIFRSLLSFRIAIRRQFQTLNNSSCSSVEMANAKLSVPQVANFLAQRRGIC